MGELKGGQVVRVIDYRREPFAQSEWLHGLSGLKRPDAEELTEHYSVLVSRGAATMMNHTRVRQASGKSAILDASLLSEPTPANRRAVVSR
jgi:hypothetical protein